MQTFSRTLLAALASGATVYAQTSSSCNPTLKSGCPKNAALGKAVEYDFTSGAPSDFTVSTGTAPVFDKNGAEFTITKSGDAPTMTSKWYMMFGHYEIVLKTSSGTGVVSSVVLQSDDLDEVDWEWLGADDGNVQTNYYGKGNTSVYDRGQTIPNAGNQDGFMTYSLDWTADAIVWAVNGKTIRTLTPDTADPNQYPQSPMQLKLGTWAAGDKSEPQGTITWAGGEIDYTKGPFTMTVQSVKAIDYSTGTDYYYGDQTGNWQSIKSDGGQINSKGDANAAVSTAVASGTAVPETSGTAVASDVPVSGGSSAPATVTTGFSGSVTGTATATVSATATSSGSSGQTTGSAGSTGSSASASASATVSHANAGAVERPGSSAAGLSLLAMIAAALVM